MMWFNEKVVPSFDNRLSKILWNTSEYSLPLTKILQNINRNQTMISLPPCVILGTEKTTKLEACNPGLKMWNHSFMILHNSYIEQASMFYSNSQRGALVKGYASRKPRNALVKVWLCGYIITLIYKMLYVPLLVKQCSFRNSLLI